MVYVLDTGVKASNREFGGRVTGGYNASHDEHESCQSCWPSCFPPCGTDTSDYHGHGTHVAAIIGGQFAGVAKNVEIRPVRFYDRECEYEVGYHVDALHWIMMDHDETAPTAIVNLSSAGFRWPTHPAFFPIRDATLELNMRNNLILVQAAGNGSADACEWTFGDEESFPAGSDEYIATAKAVIAGGSDEMDGRWTCLDGVDTNCIPGNNTGSNIGRCLDVFAPAAHIVSAWNGIDGPLDEEAVCELSGTSMAAPHVAGIAALILEAEPWLDAASVKARILEWARPDILNDQVGDPNYIGADSPNLLASVLGDLLFLDGFETGTTEVWSSTVP